MITHLAISYNSYYKIVFYACQVYRVYYDRLVDETDMKWLFQLMQKMVKQHFKDDFQVVFKHLASSSGGGKVVDDDMRSLLFGDYMKPEAVSWKQAMLVHNWCYN